MEFVPRITRAQVMDALSSQANLAGYRAVIEAAGAYGRVLPMMMTAAGTVAPAKVFVMGAGVAGLQAIATARRPGAPCGHRDRRASRRQGAGGKAWAPKFVAVEDDEFPQGRRDRRRLRQENMSAEYSAAKQAALVSEHIKKQDIVITTALIPAARAPGWSRPSRWPR